MCRSCFPGNTIMASCVGRVKHSGEDCTFCAAGLSGRRTDTHIQLDIKPFYYNLTAHVQWMLITNFNRQTNSILSLYLPLVCVEC